MVVGDRGYSNARGVAHALDQGAGVLLRLNHASMPVLARGTKKPIELIALARSLHSGGVLERCVLVQHKTQRATREIEGRVCILRLPESEARKARTRVRQEHGADVSAQVLELAGYVLLFTTVPADRLSAALCVELYRLRWQFELQFKRWKSLCGFDRMPNFRADTIASWLYAKMLSAVLLERLTSLHGEVFPPIDCDDERDNEADGEAALEVDPVAVAAARIRAVAEEALRAASARRSYH